MLLLKRDNTSSVFREVLSYLPFLPLILVAAFIATPEKYRPFGLSNYQDNYPIRIDLPPSAGFEDDSNVVNILGFEIDLGFMGGDSSDDDSGLAARRESSAEFVDAFGDLSANSSSGEANELAPAQSRAPEVDTVDLASGQSMLQLDFDLSAGPEDASSLEVVKDLQVAGEVLGALTVTIDENSSLYVSRDAVLAMLPERSTRVQRLEDEYVTLSRLRDFGVDLRYDALRDRLVLVE